MKTSPLSFVQKIFAVELNKRQGRLIKKASSLLAGKVTCSTLEKPKNESSLPNKLPDREHRSYVYKMENVA